MLALIIFTSRIKNARVHDISLDGMKNKLRQRNLLKVMA